MIHIDRNKLTSPDGEDPRFRVLVEKLMKEKSLQDFEKYRSYFKKELEGLKDHYNGKCGYCESVIDKGGAYLTLDHYRPRFSPRDDQSHPGYYWLLYEWTNLVPACPRCNTAKSNHFPIDNARGKRVTGPPIKNGCLDIKACRADAKILLNEYPLLLHPEVDEPEKHFVFLPNGRIKHLTIKGKITVELCDLNRGNLVAARKGLIDKFFKEVTHPLVLLEQKKIGKDIFIYELDKVFSKIKASPGSHRPFSRLGWFLFKKFEIFFIQRLKKTGNNKSARKLAQAYDNFKKFGTCKKPGKQV